MLKNFSDSRNWRAPPLRHRKIKSQKFCFFITASLIGLTTRVRVLVSYNLCMDPALFLDRDGVIMENRASYVRSWGDVEFYPQALEALSKVRSSPYKVFLITNQSAVGRGIITLEKAKSINQMVVNYIEQAGGRIDDVFMCPHAPDENCNCRKPRPGLILQAVEKYPVDLNRSIMVGDAISDMVAGQSAGIPFTMMVRTGRGNSQIADAAVEQISFIEVYDNLLEIFTQLFSQNPWWGT